MKRSADGFLDALAYTLVALMGLISIACPIGYLYLKLYSGIGGGFEFNFFGVISFLFPFKFYYDHIRK